LIAFHPSCLAVAVARWFPTTRVDLGPFTFAAAGGLLPDATAASLEPDGLPPRCAPPSLFHLSKIDLSAFVAVQRLARKRVVQAADLTVALGVP
jgi:hypothetical protein